MWKFFKREKRQVDAIIDSIGIVDNKLPICNFFDNVILGKPDSIKVLTHTIEGEPVFRIITYDGNKIKMTQIYNDRTEVFIGDNFKKEKNNKLIEYNLYEKEKFIIRLLFYRN
ncbi:DUF4362 domain-containing protein [Clostridium chauvoei]|uniref:Uncharacterized protein n=2 Tax=Clostridium chauvoei TaxID=46867 RepID=A0A1U6IXH5_9CLOT|nr:DUF4362 domain-containing protein [Clostridium chauvoei]ATD54180.1 hypothetical protein BTM20_02600 [Clostridium chauvoei]ATD58140.1 hypothetical protein BTM21_10475 [Clostridium chauvoei]SLK12719.1 hypothetical protein CCH01_03740 [Clostridium chauvoei JF4335]